MTRRYFPDPIDRTSAADSLIRHAAIALRCAAFNQPEAEAAKALYGEEARTVLRSAIAPTTTSTVGELNGMAQLVVALAPQSAAAQLIARGTVVDMAGRYTVTLPNRVTTADDAGAWIKEGDPFPIISLTGIGTTTPTLQPRKLACGVAVTRETVEYSALEQFVRASLGQAAGLALDKKMFSNDAAVADTSPAGILQTSPIAATAGGGLAALAKDIANLTNALAAAGGGLDPVIVCAPAQAAALRVWAPSLGIPVFPSAALSAGTVAMIEASSFVSGFSGQPVIDATSQAVVHMENATPQQFSTGGSIASGSLRSLYQTDCIALRMIVRTAFAMVVSTHAQIVQNCTW